jgi:hypothetical protein
MAATMTRTTLSLDTDLFLAVKEMARREKRPAGAVISDLVRKGFQAQSPVEKTDQPSPLEKLGIVPLPHRGGVVTTEKVQQIMDELGI